MVPRTRSLGALYRLLTVVLAFAIVEYGVAAAAPPHQHQPNYVHAIPVELAAPEHVDDVLDHTHDRSHGHEQGTHHSHEKGALTHVHAASSFVIGCDGFEAPILQAVPRHLAIAQDDGVLPRPSSPPLRPPRLL